MPEKTFDKSTGCCRVLFRLAPEAAERAWLVGDFNGWSTDATPLVRQPDGSLTVEVVLDPGRSYRFRYYLGQGQWENDWAADAYADNDYGGADSVIIIPGIRGDGRAQDPAPPRGQPD